MLSIIHEKLLEKKHDLETEVQTINNSLEDLEKANIVYGVEIFSFWKYERLGQDAQAEGQDLKSVFKETTEKFMEVNCGNISNEKTLCWAYVDGVYVYLEAGEYGEVIKKLGMER